jgi:hypothetical protein
MHFSQILSVREFCYACVMLLVVGCGGGGGGGHINSPPPPADAENLPADPAPGAGAPVGTPGVDIVSASFYWSSHQRFARGSDNWPMTWSADDNQYAMWGDGGGFDGNNNSKDPNYTSFGVSKITGDYNNYTGTNVYGGVNHQCESTLIGKSHGAPLSINNGVLYTWVTSGSDKQGGFSTFVLYRSDDNACTWSKLDVAFTADITSSAANENTDKVAYGGFVQFGKGYQSAVDNYVYVVAVRPTPNSGFFLHVPGQVMLIRVPRESIEDRSAYEFFAGLDANGSPTWTMNATGAKPIVSDAMGVGTFAQITYVPQLKRFVYTNQYGDGSLVVSPITGAQIPAGGISLLSMAQAKNIWGPYTEFYRQQFVAPTAHTPAVDTTLFQWNFAPKWFRNQTANSLDFTMIFTGTGVNDSLNVINGTFQLAPQ